jgi:putative aminopeptidase FrvX
MRKGKLYNKKHDQIVTDYENQKSKHLEKLATKRLATDEKFSILKSKTIKGKFLDDF